MPNIADLLSKNSSENADEPQKAELIRVQLEQIRVSLQILKDNGMGMEVALEGALQAPQEFPKWIHQDGFQSVLVDDRQAELELLEKRSQPVQG